MKITKVLVAIAIAGTVGFVSCKPKDADVKATVETSVQAVAANISNAAYDVKDGVVTITGEAKDEAQKAALGTAVAAVKGVKSVVNNVTIAAPPAPVVETPASVNAVLDAAAMQKVKDGLKDIKGVSVTFEGDKAVLTGEVTPKNRIKIMQILASAQVKSDVSKLVDAK